SRVTAPTITHPFSLHAALPISAGQLGPRAVEVVGRAGEEGEAGALGGEAAGQREAEPARAAGDQDVPAAEVDGAAGAGEAAERPDRKSTRLNSSHVKISYAVFC